MDEEALRSAVEVRLLDDWELEFSARVWDVVKRNEYFSMLEKQFLDALRGSDLEDADDVLSEVVGVYLQARPQRRQNSSDEKVRPASPDPGPRFRALAEILALEAGRLWNVAHFRSGVLRGKLVASDKVEAWVRRQAKKDGPFTKWLRVPTGEDGEPVSMAEARRLGYSGSLDSLRVARGDGETDILKPVAAGGVLTHLRSVASSLVPATGWTEGQAARFVLTDETPPPRPPPDIRWRITSGTRWSATGTDATSRIGLNVSPFVSPAELAKVYSDFRREWFEFERVKKLEEKTAELAVHWAKTEGMPTDQRRAEWNNKWIKKHPKWGYKGSRTNFGRDAREAYKNVMLRKQGKQGSGE